MIVLPFPARSTDARMFESARVPARCPAPAEFSNHESGSIGSGFEKELMLAPRTRSSHNNCGESDCELRVQSGTRDIGLLVPFDSEVRYRACGVLGRTWESGHSHRIEQIMLMPRESAKAGRPPRSGG